MPVRIGRYAKANEGRIAPTPEGNLVIAAAGNVQQPLHTVKMQEAFSIFVCSSRNPVNLKQKES